MNIKNTQLKSEKRRKRQMKTRKEHKRKTTIQNKKQKYNNKIAQTHKHTLNGIIIIAEENEHTEKNWNEMRIEWWRKRTHERSFTILRVALIKVGPSRWKKYNEQKNRSQMKKNVVTAWSMIHGNEYSKE